jgi:hypothetical protein
MRGAEKKKKKHTSTLKNVDEKLQWEPSKARKERNSL